MGVYKSRLRAFEYTVDELGAAPDDIVHVSASPKYDLPSPAALGIKHTVYMDRGFEPDEPWLDYERITEHRRPAGPQGPAAPLRGRPSTGRLGAWTGSPVRHGRAVACVVDNRPER
ncbi:hypothetical protein [Streptomyces sp. NPDC092370]|uniref:hypothetical protein n=1 Tax=Streptomyces sp. NPDC092370 TaxID=3366016 RepID=UPI0038267A24